jgi:hypothetical protein
MDNEKNFLPEKAQRESLAKCKTLFEVAWSCRENDDMAGYADALADIMEEFNKFNPDIADCGMPISSAGVVASIREERSRQELDWNLQNIMSLMENMEKLLGISFLVDLMRPKKK